MSTKKKGFLTTSKEWRKHLRAWGRRAFWKGERQAERRIGRDQKGPRHDDEGESQVPRS